MPTNVLTPPEAAALLRVAPKQVRRLIAAGKLAAVNVGMGEQRERWRITREAVDQFLNPPVPTRGRHLRVSE